MAPVSGKWARDPLDWYVEPSWTSARLFEQERFESFVIDPACGLGTIIENAQRAGLSAHGTDIVNRVGGDRHFFTEIDFFDPNWIFLPFGDADSIVSNPPFRHADAFARLSITRARSKVALLLPATWHLGDKRSRWLETTPLRRIWNLTPRPSMPPGTHIEAGGKPGNGTQDFAWYVWLKGYDGPVETRWLRRDP